MAKYIVKSGAHSRIENGKRISYQKGDVIEAIADELKPFMDKFELVGPPDPPPKMANPSKSLKAIHKGGGRWNVINTESGKKINQNLLSRDEAQALINDGIILDNS